MSVADKSPQDPHEKKPHRDPSDEEKQSEDASSNEDLESLSDEEKIDALIQELSHQESDEDDDQETDQSSRNARIKAQLKALMEKSKNAKKDASQSPSKRGRDAQKRRVFMVQLGGAFHGNFIVNLILLYLVNLVIILGLLELFNFGQFPPELWRPIAFTFVYTASEFMFKEFMVARFSKYVLMTFGILFYIGYVVIFYLVDALIFFDTQIFAGEAELAVFTLLFMLVRQLMSILIKKGLTLKL